MIKKSFLIVNRLKFILWLYKLFYNWFILHLTPPPDWKIQTELTFHMSTLNSLQTHVSGSSYLHTLRLHPTIDYCFINRLNTLTVSEDFISVGKLFYTLRPSSLNFQLRVLYTARKLQEKDVKMLTGIKDPETLKFQLILNSNFNFN